MSAMNTAVVQKLVDSIRADKLKEVQKNALEIQGENSQDKLANLAAAIWIADKMQTSNLDFETTLMAYLEKTKQALK
jgi:hypothetical protein